LEEGQRAGDACVGPSSQLRSGAFRAWIPRLAGRQSGGCLPSLKQAIESDPNSALACLSLGSAYNSMRHCDTALEALSAFSGVAADNWQLHYELARS